MYMFTDDCLTGIEVIDNEHRKLFAIINEAFELLEKPGMQAAGAKNLIMALKSYAHTHFAHEEAYMAKIKDPELSRQRREHKSFIAKIDEINLDILNDEKGKEVLEDTLKFLTRWLYHHILGSDIMIGKISYSEAADPYAFTDKYRTGIELVDNEHMKLFEIIRQTDEAIHAEMLHDKYDVIMDIIDELRDYTILHFNDEEKYMESIKYEGLEHQRLAHQAFVDRLNDINLNEVDDNQQEYLEELIEFLMGWLVNHILKMDKLIPVTFTDTQENKNN